MPYTSGDRIREKAKKKIKKKAKQKAKSKAKKVARGIHTASYIIWALALILGIVAGILYGMFACRKDCFELNGPKNFDFEVGEALEYVDPKVKIIEFGRDISDRVEIETNMQENANGTYTVDTSEPGVYYIKYTVDSVRYGEVCRIRTITIGGED